LTCSTLKILFANVLKKGGTLIMFFDIWKISVLKRIMEKYKFKQIRFIEWTQTNPHLLYSSVNYLTNCRKIALLGIKEANRHLIVNMTTIWIHFWVQEQQPYLVKIQK
jgi:hypothetical protein